MPAGELILPSGRRSAARDCCQRAANRQKPGPTHAYCDPHSPGTALWTVSTFCAEDASLTGVDDHSGAAVPEHLKLADALRTSASALDEHYVVQVHDMP